MKRNFCFDIGYLLFRDCIHLPLWKHLNIDYNNKMLDNMIITEWGVDDVYCGDVNIGQARYLRDLWRLDMDTLCSGHFSIFTSCIMPCSLFIQFTCSDHNSHLHTVYTEQAWYVATAMLVPWDTGHNIASHSQLSTEVARLIRPVTAEICKVDTGALVVHFTAAVIIL